MHPQSFMAMTTFSKEHVKPGDRVLDVGALDVNGTYRELFYDYTGLDIVPGDNVDVVASEAYDWSNEIADGQFDAVISGQTFEHVEDDKALIREMARVLKPGGFCCVIAPSSGPPHAGADYRRYSAESMSELASVGGLEVVSCEVNMFVRPWRDVVLVARKPEKEDSDIGDRGAEEVTETVKPRRRQRFST